MKVERASEQNDGKSTEELENLPRFSDIQPQRIWRLLNGGRWEEDQVCLMQSQDEAIRILRHQARQQLIDKGLMQAPAHHAEEASQIKEELDRLRSACIREDSNGEQGKVWASLFRSGHVRSKFLRTTGNGMLQQALQSMRLMPPSQADGDIQANAVQPSEGADGLEADDQEESKAREALRKLLRDYNRKKTGSSASTGDE